MPYSSLSDLPSSVKDNLPEHAQSIYMAAFNSAYEGTCKDSDQKDACASKVAWSAVSRSYEKNEEGKWVKKSINTLSMVITKATFDKATGEMRWAGTVSDTDLDLYEEQTSIELFKDFLDRIERGEKVPEVFQSKFWDGGMPYISLSHYFDMDGKAALGTSTSFYIDGKMLKAKGIFYDTPLGRAAFKAVCKSQTESPLDPDDEKRKIRFSIGFLDYGHSHSGEYEFIRHSLSDSCEYCNKGIGGIIYTKGYLVHLALTRVPANERTEISILEEKSMGKIRSKREDAISIVGEDLVEDLEENMVERSVAGDPELENMLVIKSDETTEETEITPPVEEILEISEAPKEVVTEESVSSKDLLEKIDKILSIVENKSISTEKDVIEKSEYSDLYAEFDKFVERFAQVMDGNYSTVDEQLMGIQDPFNELGNAVRNKVKKLSLSKAESQAENNIEDTPTILKSIITEALVPITDKIGMLESQLTTLKSINSSVLPTDVTVRRSLTPKQVEEAPSAGGSFSVRDISRRSVGLVG